MQAKTRQISVAPTENSHVGSYEITLLLRAESYDVEQEFTFNLEVLPCEIKDRQEIFGFASPYSYTVLNTAL